MLASHDSDEETAGRFLQLVAAWYLLGIKGYQLPLQG